MIRATTPTHEFRFGEDVRSSDFSKVLITYVQNNSVILEKDEDDLDWHNNMASVTLTQAETKLFSPLYDVEIQVRTLDTDGLAQASPIIRRKVFDVLDDEALT